MRHSVLRASSIRNASAHPNRLYGCRYAGSKIRPDTPPRNGEPNAIIILDIVR